MRILIDLDDTLVNMMGKAIYYYNNRYKTAIKLENLTEWELANRTRWEDIWRIPGFFADLPWMDDMAQEVLRQLKDDGHELVIVSAVPTWESCKDKYAWCHTNLRIPGIIRSMDQVVLTRGKQYIEGDCMVDDKPANLDGRRHPIVFDRPWNRKFAVPRATTWREVYRHVQSAQWADLAPRTSFHLGGCV